MDEKPLNMNSSFVRPFSPLPLHTAPSAIASLSFTRIQDNHLHYRRETTRFHLSSRSTSDECTLIVNELSSPALISTDSCIDELDGYETLSIHEEINHCHRMKERIQTFCHKQRVEFKLNHAMNILNNCHKLIYQRY